MTITKLEGKGPPREVVHGDDPEPEPKKATTKKKAAPKASTSTDGEE